MTLPSSGRKQAIGRDSVVGVPANVSALEERESSLFRLMVVVKKEPSSVLMIEFGLIEKKVFRKV